jgi:hypothetical protein
MYISFGKQNNLWNKNALKQNLLILLLWWILSKHVLNLMNIFFVTNICQFRICYNTTTNKNNNNNNNSSNNNNNNVLLSPTVSQMSKQFTTPENARKVLLQSRGSYSPTLNHYVKTCVHLTVKGLSIESCNWGSSHSPGLESLL